MRGLITALLWLLALHPVLAQEAPKLPCGDRDRACAAKALREHAVRRTDAWEAQRARPIAERIGPAPPPLVEYLNLDNILNGFPEKPRASRLDPAFLADAKAAIAELPPEVWRLFTHSLMGVYFVDALGGTGYSDYVVDKDQKPVGGYIVLDASLLALHTANGWATWKENTPFKVQTAYQLQARIETDTNNNRKNAIQYILLHELGHVLSIANDVHPPWTLQPRDVQDTQAYAFFNLSWTVDRPANRYVSVFDGSFPQRKDVVYYLGAELAGEDMVATYTGLEQTNFASLYATVRPGDDFAEAFASYVHVILMKRPWQITISRNGAQLKSFNACWEEARCAPKRRILEQILKRAG